MTSWSGHPAGTWPTTNGFFRPLVEIDGVTP
jgi:hypothetical protein